MWFDPRGVQWIQTDDGAYTDVTKLYDAWLPYLVQVWSGVETAK